MFEAPVPDSAHSASVTLTLVAKNGTFPLSHVGSNRIVLSEPKYIEAGNAEVLMSVDGRKYRWNVVLRRDVFPFDSNTIRVRLRGGHPVT
ncbi:MAG: hypothetical protein IT428_31900 [Planctomycetaceae bacterium]|nr:hypothetical protein [Planctomycetaceae bacterium]